MGQTKDPDYRENFQPIVTQLIAKNPEFKVDQPKKLLTLTNFGLVLNNCCFFDIDKSDSFSLDSFIFCSKITDAVKLDDFGRCRREKFPSGLSIVSSEDKDVPPSFVSSDTFLQEANLISKNIKKSVTHLKTNFDFDLDHIVSHHLFHNSRTKLN